MKLINIQNPRYNKNGTIDCEILIEHFPDYIPFTASANDSEKHGRLIYKDLIAGKYGKIDHHFEPEPDV